MDELPAESAVERAEAALRAARALRLQNEQAERDARREAAAEAARLAAEERVREAATREAARVAAASKAREEAEEAVAAATAAVAKADALERAMAEDGEGDSSGAAGPLEAGEAAEVPEDFICPITAEIMTDPVSTADGFSYERAAITEWLRTKDTSPTTGATLESKKLIPNHSLRSIIRRFTEARAASAPPLSRPARSL